MYEQKHVAWLAEQHLDYDAEQTRNDFIRLDLWCEVQRIRSLSLNSALAQGVNQSFIPTPGDYTTQQRPAFVPVGVCSPDCVGRC